MGSICLVFYVVVVGIAGCLSLCLFPHLDPCIEEIILVEFELKREKVQLRVFVPVSVRDFGWIPVSVY
jgi:hypothetical protein